MRHLVTVLFFLFCQSQSGSTRKTKGWKKDMSNILIQTTLALLLSSKSHWTFFEYVNVFIGVFTSRVDS